MVQFGSSLFFYCCADRLIQDERVRGNPFLIPETYSVAAGTNNGGTLQKWYLEQLFSECLEKEKTAGLNAYEEMMKGISEISPGSDGLITLPYFAGERTPLNDPDARGMIVGLSLSHTKRHLYRSALEGIGYSVAQHIDIFRENGLPVNRIAAAGGGTKKRSLDADGGGYIRSIVGNTKGRHRGSLWRCTDGSDWSRILPRFFRFAPSNPKEMYL